MLSGVGPQSHLTDLGIPVVADISGIGSNLRDHTFVGVDYEVSPDLVGKPELATLPPDEEATPTQDLVNLAIAFVREPKVLHSEGLSSLPVEEQRFIKRHTTPTYEIAAGGNWPKDIPHEKATITVKALCMGIQSTGTIRLQSPSATDAPLIDPNYLAHPFDRFSMVTQVKTLVDLVENTDLAKSIIKPIARPKSTSNEDVIDFIEETLGTGWHPVGTAKMGLLGDPDACVDKDFKVVGGIEGLRVIDLSVCPFMPSVHTTSVAYLISAWGAERLIEEYHLN